jgi:hypothetical protein
MRRRDPASTASSAATRHELLDKRDLHVETADSDPAVAGSGAHNDRLRAPNGAGSARDVFGDRVHDGTYARG